MKAVESGLGRYGADDGTRKVRLEITVDRWISEGLGKIRTKRSVSNMVNGLLAIVIRQFDPGPSSPLIYDLDRLLRKHKGEAEASGDAERVASIALLRAQLEPYIALAEAGPSQQNRSPGLSASVAQRGKDEKMGGHFTCKDNDDHQRDFLAKEYAAHRDYDWYAVPLICHETPMVYLRGLNTWRCVVCGSLCHDR